MRVGPAQLTGLDSAQKGWADLGPTVLSASLGLGRMWPRHEGWARKEKKKGGGELFSPSHPLAFVLHARETYTKNEVKVEGKEELPGTEEAVPCWFGYFAGGAAVEADGGVVAHGRQLQAAVLLFQAAKREVTAIPPLL